MGETGDIVQARICEKKLLQYFAPRFIRQRFASAFYSHLVVMYRLADLTFFMQNSAKGNMSRSDF